MHATRRGLAAVALGAVCALACAAPALAASPVQLVETGSTLLFPAFNVWVPAYAKNHPGVRITTQGTGSGVGITDAISGLAQIGASDAYMAPALVAQNPGVLNIPLAVSAQQVNYNLPQLGKVHLKLSGPVLAAMYTGAVKYWDDRSIAALNPGVKLPHLAVVPVHRLDGSGDTFIFTQYLSFSTPSWNQAVGYGTKVTWPSPPTATGATGNNGVVTLLQKTPGAVGYVGISWLNAANKDGLGYAALKNRAGRFVLPTTATIAAAVTATASKTPANERISLIFAPGGNSYPIINYEYALVKSTQPNAATATALREFLTWIIDPAGGSQAQYLGVVHFQALPAPIEWLSLQQVAAIGS